MAPSPCPILSFLSSSSSPSPSPSPLSHPDAGAGSGSHLPFFVLLAASLAAGGSTLLSLWTVWLQLKHYHRPRLQRMVVRILVMVPIYSISSLISLYSLDAAFFVDAFRDIYEAFVIYCFFSLLVEYIGGERSLIITLHGRPPHPHPRPVRWFLSDMDASDPFTFLGLKRGILQYVWLKPVLAIVTCILKATGTYNDGHLAKDSGYTYLSIVYNLSVSLSLYCLAMFWVATHDDLKPFRPMPKFLSVKGIIFFSFWQSFAVSIFVALGWIKSDRYETEQLSLAVQDTLIALEMPLFAFLHLYAFSYTDYVDKNHVYSGRLRVWDAARDAFGTKDLLLDARHTARGTGFSYRTFEPASGALHSEGLVRDRRIAAGLRYSTQEGKKYWLDMPRGPGANRAGEAYTRQGLRAGLASRPVHEVKRRLERRVEEAEGYAPGSHDERVWHVDPAERHGDAEEEREGGEGEGTGGAGKWRSWWEGHRDYEELSEGEEGESEPESLEFHGKSNGEEEEEAEEEGKKSRKDEWEEMERIYREARELEYGDWRYPVIDASREAERRRWHDEEDAFLHGRLRNLHYHRRPHHSSSSKKDKGKGKEPLLPASRPGAKHRPSSYGALAEREPSSTARPSPSPASFCPSRPSSPSRSPSPSHPTPSFAHPSAIGSSLVHASSQVLSSVLPFSLSRHNSSSSSVSNKLPPDAVDLVVEDVEAEEEEQERQRRRGEPSGKRTRVYRVAYKLPKEAEEGKELPSRVKGETARVMDQPRYDGETEEAVEREREGGVERERVGREKEGVRVVVEEEERVAVQVGADKEGPGEGGGEGEGGRGGGRDEDNPWV
ncbi:hypothetical protein JCM8547_003323 [Rhodosporidiobolus lusitaniae]